MLIKLGGTVFNKHLFANVKQLNHVSLLLFKSEISQCKRRQAQSTVQYFGVRLLQTPKNWLKLWGSAEGKARLAESTLLSLLSLVWGLRLRKRV